MYTNFCFNSDEEKIRRIIVTFYISVEYRLGIDLKIFTFER